MAAGSGLTGEAAPAALEGALPAAGTLERWASDYLLTTELGHKLAPPPAPRVLAPPSVAPHVAAVRISAPGRPRELVVGHERVKTPGPEALRSPERRARLVHTFLHHELQAAELMCWAILAFPETPEAFRTGLAHIAQDEVRHMALYHAYLETLGCRFGDYPVRDWFWERVPTATSPPSFVATLGIGFEGANLDHTLRFAERFRAIGDEAGARIQDQVHDEEIPHVRFALRWFRHWTGSDDFASWTRSLPPPLSPLVMRGAPVRRAPRLRAGMSEAFVDALDRWQPSPPAREAEGQL